METTFKRSKSVISERKQVFVCDFDEEDDVEVIRDEDCTIFEIESLQNGLESRQSLGERMRVSKSENEGVRRYL